MARATYVILGCINLVAMIGYMLGHSTLASPRLRSLRRIRQEIKPFVLPIIIIRYLAQVTAQADDGALINTDALLTLTIDVWFWLRYRRDDDDDRWRRRRREAGRLVRTAAGRLTISPAPSSTT
jgi:hypothetical protein